MPHSAIFLDRDGVINENRADYVKSLAEFRFLDNVFHPLESLSHHYRLVVVSNQSAVGRGIISSSDVDFIHEHMLSEFEAGGIRIDGVYWCPHHPDAACACRKPRPGLITRAAAALGLDLSRSYLIGDACSDMEAALSAGVTPALVLTGRGKEQYRLLKHRVRVHENLAAVARWILSEPRPDAGHAPDSHQDQRNLSATGSTTAPR